MTMYLLVSEKIYANLSKYRKKIYAKENYFEKLINKKPPHCPFYFYNDELATLRLVCHDGCLRGQQVAAAG